MGTAGTYTTAHAVVETADGIPAVQLRWAGVSGFNFKGSVAIEQGDRFSLTVVNAAGATVLSLTDASLDPADPRYLVTLVNAAYTQNARWTAAELRDAPTSAAPAESTDSIAFVSQYYPFVVHTGMIA